MLNNTIILKEPFRSLICFKFKFFYDFPSQAWHMHCAHMNIGGRIPKQRPSYDDQGRRVHIFPRPTTGGDRVQLTLSG